MKSTQVKYSTKTFLNIVTFATKHDISRMLFAIADELTGEYDVESHTQLYNISTIWLA